MTTNDNTQQVPVSVLLRARNMLRVWAPDDGATAATLEPYLVDTLGLNAKLAESMVPGTTFYVRRAVRPVWLLVVKRGRGGFLDINSGAVWSLSDLDMDTIRDVTLPPSAPKEAS
jgi:hypothetical protein